MSKRFIDTELFDDPWFMDLSLSGKILWVYCITKCNHAGIIEVNLKLAQFQTGIKSIQTVIKELGNRLVSVKDRYYFIPKYIDFQYPGFPNSKVRQQASAIEILKKFNLFDDSLQTVNKELSNSYEHDNVSEPVIVTVNGKGKKSLMRNSGTTLTIIEEAFSKSDDLLYADPKYYYNSALAWSDSGGNMRIDWIATVSNFARRDMRDQKLKIKKKTRQEIEKAPDNFGVVSKTATKMPEGLKKRISNIGKDEIIQRK